MNRLILPITIATHITAVSALYIVIGEPQFTQRGLGYYRSFGVRQSARRAMEPVEDHRTLCGGRSAGHRTPPSAVGNRSTSRISNHSRMDSPGGGAITLSPASNLRTTSNICADSVTAPSR